MTFDLDRRAVRLGVGEFSQFAPGPPGPERSRGGGGLWRARLGSEWHGRLRERAAAGDPNAEFEVAIEGTIVHRGWKVSLHGRIDQLVRGGTAALIREVKTVTLPLPAAEPGLRAAYPEYFVQLAAYRALMLLDPAGRAVDRAELVFVEAAGGVVQEVPLIAEDDALFRGRLDALAGFLDHRLQARNRLRNLSFRLPFDIARPGQEGTCARLLDAASAANSAVLLEAPTGFGKTGILLEFALGRLRAGDFERVLYLTGKSTGQIQVVRTLDAMTLPGSLTVWQVRAKSEHCVNHVFHCVREGCAYIDRIAQRWEASGLSRIYLFDAQARDLETLKAAGRSAVICPYEITRAALPYNDIWIGDYNYVFAPANRGFFNDQPGFDPARTLLIVDEAHNLPSRAADAWSHTFDAAAARETGEALSRTRAPSSLVLSWDGWTRFLESLEPCGRLGPEAGDEARRILGELAGAIPGTPLDSVELGPGVTDTLWKIPAWRESLELAELPWLWWSPRGGELSVTCLDASASVGATLREFGGVVLASATPGPPADLAATLGLDAATPPGLAHVRASTPWRNGAYDVACDLRVDTRFGRRARHHADTARTIAAMRPDAHTGMVVFFPSYAYAEAIAALLSDQHPDCRVAIQPRSVSLAAQESWIDSSLDRGDVLFLVTGSGFSEGIDLLGNRVSHAIVVGPSLPEVNPVQRARMELISADHGGDAAFRRIYLVPGMQKVNQALGRLVRAPQQRARVLLHCRRFAEPAYAQLLDPDLRPRAVIESDADFAAWLEGFR